MFYRRHFYKVLNESIRHGAIWSCCFQVVIVTTHLKSLWHLRESADTHEGQTNGEGCLEWWWFQNKADVLPW